MKEIETHMGEIALPFTIHISADEKKKRYNTQSLNDGKEGSSVLRKVLFESSTVIDMI